MPTYRIIGADQKEYGPVDRDQIRAWIAQGRVNAGTQVRSDESGGWKRLADFSEFSREFGTGAPSPSRPPPAPDAKTSGMAIASLILGIFGLFTCGVSAIAGLVLGIVSMKGIQKSNGQLRGHGIALAGTIVSGAFLFLLPLLAAIMVPAIARPRIKLQTARCMNNLTLLNAATQIYSAKNHDRFPPASTWCDAIKSEVLSERPFECPAAHNGERCHYAFNARLDGLERRQVAPDTVMFFETDGGWNLSGGPELMLHSPRHLTRFVVAFADGSVRQITRAELGHLRWNPVDSL
jgi:prepilin-type processing-associated H-X9-DG protein